MAFSWEAKFIGTPDALREYLRQFPDLDRISRFVVHNTVSPLPENWAGKRTMDGIGNYYRGLGWNGGPHLFVAPDGIWIGSTPTAETIHSNQCNHDGLAMEVVGWYDTHDWAEPIRGFAIGATAAALEWLHLGPEAITGHRYCGSKKTCPGSAVDLGYLRHLVSMEMGRGPRWFRTTDVTNVRTAPDRRTGRVVKQFQRNTLVPVGSLTLGDNVSGNPRWYWDPRGIGFWHSSIGRDERPSFAPPYKGEDVLMCTPRTGAERVKERILAWKHDGYTDDEIFQLVDIYFAICQRVGMDPVFAISQMLHETGGFGASEWSSPSYKNPAGLGVTGQVSDKKPKAGVWQKLADGKWHEGLKFATLEDAVKAHVGRLLRYAVVTGQEVPVQKALMDFALGFRALPQDRWGAAPILNGLNGRWAVPGNGYGDRIAEIANKLCI